MVDPLAGEKAGWKAVLWENWRAGHWADASEPMRADSWAVSRAGATAGWSGHHLAVLWGAKRAAELARNLADL